MYCASETKVETLTRIRRERVLPRPGKILVSVEDQVKATQVVARTDLPGQYSLVPVARQLDVPEAHLDDCWRVGPGDRVQRGDVIAERGGFFGRSVESPSDGTVQAIIRGSMLIESHSVPVEIRSYVPGTVVEVSDNRSVVIEAVGALIQGMWGSGGEGFGILTLLASGPDDTLRPDAIDPSCHGAILVSGVIADEQTIEKAEHIEAGGIVVGALSPQLVSVVEESSFPVVVTDGIGERSMARPIFDLLKANDGVEAAVSGLREPRRSRKRPEVIVPRPDREFRGSAGERGEGLALGTWVRIVRAPYSTSVGVVVALPKYARPIETGTRVPCAEVDIGRDNPVTVPLVNLDVLRR